MNHLRPVTNLIFSILVTFLSALTTLPLVFVGIISISSESSIAKKGYSFFPQQLSLDAYRYLIRSLDTIGRSFLVSVFVTVLGTLISLWLISTMAYVISRYDFAFRRFYTILILIPMFFSGGLVASYAVNTQLFALKNSIWALVLPQACSGWYIIVMRTYFSNNIPEDIIDAARIDGAGTLRIFCEIVIPLSKPVFAAIGLFEAISYWNSWYNAMLYLRPEHQELYPLQYLLYSIQRNVEFMSTNDMISGALVASMPTEAFRMAIVVVITAPILLTYPLVRKYFIKGMLIGGLKG